jgi:hypothetical protein
VTQNQGHIPQSIVAGESIWIAAANTAQSRSDLTFTDYTPAGGYTLAYAFAATSPVSVAGAANGDNTGWTLEVTAAVTLTWRAGVINYAGYVTHTTSGRKFAVDAGSIAVTASPLATSQWTAIVAACDAAILSGATSGTISFSVDGMSVSYRQPSELMHLRDYARMMELQDKGDRPRRIIRTRFT